MKSQKQKDRDVVSKRKLRAESKYRLINAAKFRDEFNALLVRSFPPEAA